MTMRQRKRRFRAGLTRGLTRPAALVFPPPAETWGTVSHTIGPFVPLPIRRDARFERRLARRLAAVKAALVITEA